MCGVRIRHLGELHADTKTGAAVDDPTVGLQFVFLDPDADGKLRSLLQGNGHFDETAAIADIHGFSPDGSGLSRGLKLHGNLALQASVVASVRNLSAVGCFAAIPNRLRLRVGIRSFGRKWGVPDAFVLGDIDQTNLVRCWCPQLADPLDAEAAFLLSLADTDDLAGFEAGFDSIQASAVVADIEAVDAFGKHLSFSVSAEDPHGNADWMPGLAPVAHKLRGKNDANS